MSSTINSVQTASKAAPTAIDTEVSINKKSKPDETLNELKNLASAQKNTRLSELVAELVEMLASFSKLKLPKKVKKTKAATQKAEAVKVEELKTGTAPTTDMPVTAAATQSTETAGTVVKENGIYTSLNSVKNPDGTISLFTEDGYVVSTENKEQGWTIKSPEGNVTRIWGDPHVVESDGDKWDFKQNSSFIFGNNKVSIETAPAPNGQTYTSKITVYSHDSRATVSGIDKDLPVLDILKQDAVMDDAIRDDGDLFILTKETGGDDKFVLLKDVGEKFDEKFASKVAVGEKLVFDKLLTDEQKKLLGRVV